MHNERFPLKLITILPRDINLQLEFTPSIEVLLTVFLSCIGTFLL